ncbi:putative glucuronosyltransferase PGSIP8 [Elaeis guineensis]|uniref:Glucuronosyltransferase PGSIP8 n=1 Tax=Elaeis guineensis var. tenera TaxID=51953 RepID=A0A6I9SDC0_ELAGV|nr:putative glucuronosyltransferase PGSIP8 [Elaeis guineensis]
MGRRLELVVVVVVVVVAVLVAAAEGKRRPHAYAAMMYMGTSRDYEFYVATRVMMRSLVKLRVDADLVVIASSDVPIPWIQSLKEDGVKVVTVENLKNPYEKQDNFNTRFKLTLNKLYAWSLVAYDRVVMLDSDNLFLQRTDELFQCGQFCAVFINPCIFHTGLFVLQPSMEVFRSMLHELEIGRQNRDGADQGFLTSYFPDLLDRPMFHPPSNGSNLGGIYRLPLGYQMDASYYYLKLRWSIPCGPNSVITFPSALWLKPWYWWSWPVLPLGFSWHEQRRKTLGYSSELPVILIQSVLYLGVMAGARMARPSLSKLCYNRRAEKRSFTFSHTMIKVAVLWCILAAYTIPFFLIPCTVHPLLGWSLYLFGSSALASIVINLFMLPPFPVLTPWVGIFGALFVMAFPWYSDGIVRALSLFAYAFCCAPVVWGSLMRVLGSLQLLLEREAFFPKLGELTLPPRLSKFY